MSSDLDAIKAIVDAFERSDWTEIDVSSGSLRIHLSTQPQADAGTAAAMPASRAGGAPGGEPTTAADSADSVDSRPIEIAVVPAGSHAVISPSPGIFWRAPHPGAPPFAELGEDVEPGSTLCIVEVMKLMNHISSSVAGTVVGVFVENGMRIDRGDTLFAVQPSASP